MDRRRVLADEFVHIVIGGEERRLPRALVNLIKKKRGDDRIGRNPNKRCDEEWPVERLELWVDLVDDKCHKALLQRRFLVKVSRGVLVRTLPRVREDLDWHAIALSLGRHQLRLPPILPPQRQHSRAEGCHTAEWRATRQSAHREGTRDGDAYREGTGRTDRRGGRSIILSSLNYYTDGVQLYTSVLSDIRRSMLSKGNSFIGKPLYTCTAVWKVRRRRSIFIN